MLKIFSNFLAILFLLSFSIDINANDTLTVSSVSAYPKIPLIEIITEDAKEPSCNKISAPEGCFGESIINNNYVYGNLKLWNDNKAVMSTGDFNCIDYGMKIKIRGNSSGANLAQHPYKIKLNSKNDLISPDTRSCLEKEFVLLSTNTYNNRFTTRYTDILPLIGGKISELLRCKWTPRYKFVNLVINGTFRGCYILADAITRGDDRIDIKKTGFIIEDDAYWWNEGDDYFKTDNLAKEMGYTFKYPSDEAITDSVKTLYQDYMNTIENVILAKSDASKYISYKSFAQWILVHDILGTSDAAGSNIYLYNKDLVPTDYDSTKLHMGPTWDYDASFKVADNSFSTIHNSSLFYYQKLFENNDFCSVYKQLWTEAKDSLFRSVNEYLDSINVVDGTEIDKSLALSRKLYGYISNSFSNQCIEVMTFLKQRLSAIDKLIDSIDDDADAIEEITVKQNSKTKLSIYDLQGRQYKSIGSLPQHGIFIVDKKLIAK